MIKTNKKKVSKNLWKEEHILQIYQLAKQGFSNKGISQALGVRYIDFIRWSKTKLSVINALQEARKGEGGTETFRDFVYGSLPPDLQKLWKEINRVSDGRTLSSRVNALLRPISRKNRQHLFLYALIYCNFNMTRACKVLNLPKKELQLWTDDPEFTALLAGIHQCKKDFFESALMRLVKKGDTASVIFANRTLNRDRGYNDKVEISGEISHNHQVSIDQLNLPLEVRQQLLQAVRERKQLPKPVEIIDAPDRESP